MFASVRLQGVVHVSREKFPGFTVCYNIGINLSRPTVQVEWKWKTREWKIRVPFLNRLPRHAVIRPFPAASRFDMLWKQNKQ
jgi:hypothetical protein